MESWADPGDKARPRLPCNLGTRPSKNFGRPGNEATGLLNLQLKLAVSLTTIPFLSSVNKYNKISTHFQQLLATAGSVKSQRCTRSHPLQPKDIRFPRV